MLAALRFIPAVLIFPALLEGCLKKASRSEPKGLFTTKHVQETYVIWDNDLTEEQIARRIAAVNPKRHDPKYSNEELGRLIIRVAHAFAIDPRVLTGMVEAESTYDRTRRSRTGAVSFTQFVGIGIQEVCDQLGARGDKHARQAAVTYFKDTADEIYHELAGQDRPDICGWSLNAKKSRLVEDGPLSLIFAAILLKTYISNDKTNSPRKSTFALYQGALLQYNDEPPPHNYNYRDNVLSYASNL